jgi:hypothetical protein
MGTGDNGQHHQRHWRAVRPRSWLGGVLAGPLISGRNTPQQYLPLVGSGETLQQNETQKRDRAAGDRDQSR